MLYIYAYTYRKIYMCSSQYALLWAAIFLTLVLHVPMLTL